MLTEKEIQAKALELVAMGEAPLWGGGFVNGATWANEQATAHIAELQSVNSEQADKIVDLQARREEHLRTIAELMGEKAGLLNMLRENLETTPAAMDYIQVRLKTKRTLEKHGVK